MFNYQQLLCLEQLEEEQKTQSMVCQLCSKHFSTENAYQNHIQSKKHREVAAKAHQQVTHSHTAPSVHWTVSKEYCGIMKIRGHLIFVAFEGSPLPRIYMYILSNFERLSFLTETENDASTK